MSRILIAWELGGNYGHLTRCLGIAEVLRERGHTVAFAVKDTRTAAELLGKTEFAYFQAPHAGKATKLARPPVNFSELLIGVGYADQWALLGMAQAWLALYRLYRPDVILADHAPTSLFAAYLADIPAVPIGNGFAIPPAVSPQPSIRPWEKVSAQHLMHADNMVNTSLAAVHKALGKGAGTAPDLAALYASNAVLDCFPELDCFGERKTANYIGPILFNAGTQKVQWTETGSDNPRVLAYLNSKLAGFAELMQALKKSEHETIAVVPDLSPEQAQALSSPQLSIHTSLIDMRSLLPDASLTVGYGGAATTAAALLAGSPMLLLPYQVEQYLTAQCVSQIGAGVVLGQERSEAVIAESLALLCERETFTEKAKAFAQKYAVFDVAKPVQLVVTALERAI